MRGSIVEPSMPAEPPDDWLEIIGSESTYAAVGLDKPWLASLSPANFTRVLTLA
ncbi:MAG TPA: hypothetical protein VE136_16725 [Anaerolineales bacterium]|nr:hypothetical protein [Anaerolineales bacterium]